MEDSLLSACLLFLSFFCSLVLVFHDVSLGTYIVRGGRVLCLGPDGSVRVVQRSLRELKFCYVSNSGKVRCCNCCLGFIYIGYRFHVSLKTIYNIH